MGPDHRSARATAAVKPARGSPGVQRLTASALDRNQVLVRRNALPTRRGVRVGSTAREAKTLLERALGAELDDHLGKVEGDPASNGSGNSRNRHYGKSVTTTAGRCGSRRPGTATATSTQDRPEGAAAAGSGRRHDLVAARAG